MQNRKFRIGYFADGPWSHRALEKILMNPSNEVSFIVPRTDTKDDTLKTIALSNRIDYLHPVKINDKEFIEIAKSYNCDLFVSMSFNQIFKNEIINIPQFKTINCHAGKLPFYRGRNVLNWVLINDENEFGITVHYVDEGIDTGDIILQNTYPITDNDNYGSILEKAFSECGLLLYEAIEQIKNGTSTRTPQIEKHPVGFYCGGREIGDELIDWNNTSRDIFNFIRALSKPGPIARTKIRDQEIKISKSSFIEKAPEYKNFPGQIVGKTARGFLVKTKDTFIEIYDIEFDGKLKIGDRLG